MVLSDYTLVKYLTCYRLKGLSGGIYEQAGKSIWRDFTSFDCLQKLLTSFRNNYKLYKIVCSSLSIYIYTHTHKHTYITAHIYKHKSNALQELCIVSMPLHSVVITNFFFFNRPPETAVLGSKINMASKYLSLS